MPPVSELSVIKLLSILSAFPVKLRFVRFIVPSLVDMFILLVPLAVKVSTFADCRESRAETSNC